MEYLELCENVQMPVLGYGVYRVDETECERCVNEALETGYRLIDTATAYHNERAVGRALQTCGIDRKELFITTKVIRCGSEALTCSEFYRSLEALGLDYIDLYLIHQPYGDLFATWRAMEELHSKGLIRAIGVCNFSSVRLADLSVNNRIAPMLNQIQIDPFMQRSDELKYMKRNGVITQAWGPLSQGNRAMYDSPVLKRIAEDHGGTVAQIVLKWHLQRGETVVVKTTRKARMLENIEVFGKPLSVEEMARIATLDNGTTSDPHNDPEFVKTLCGRWDLIHAEKELEEGKN